MKKKTKPTTPPVTPTKGQLDAERERAAAIATNTLNLIRGWCCCE